MEAWEEIPQDLILRAMKACGITSEEDGSQDHMIHCFKEEEPSSAGPKILSQRRQDDESSEGSNSDDEEEEVMMETHDPVDLDAGVDFDRAFLDELSQGTDYRELTGRKNVGDNFLM